MRRIFTVVFLVFLFTSCKKRDAIFITPSIHDYYPLEVGKYITYNLDSTLFINFGRLDTVIHYQAKDEIDAAITDNLGRHSYRVIRFIRKRDTDPWVAAETYMVTPLDNSIEVVENNLRFIKLSMPLKLNHSWKGNGYLDTYSAESDLRYMDDWDYIYDSVAQPITLDSMVIDSTIKVFERDEFLGQDPNMQGTQYAEKNYSVEKYGKGIGLIYRELLHWEYQGPQPGRPGYYDGFGIKLTLTGHN